MTRQYTAWHGKQEVVERGYTHFITDVFEGEAHSPLNFHTRVLGFEVIGRHLFGELNCSSTRIILTLDILKLYNRIKDSRSRIYQELAGGLHAAFGKRLPLSRASIDIASVSGAGNKCDAVFQLPLLPLYS